MGTGSFPGVKRPGCGFDHPPPSSAEVKDRVELYLYFPFGPSWPVLGRTLLYLYLYTSRISIENSSENFGIFCTSATHCTDEGATDKCQLSYFWREVSVCRCHWIGTECDYVPAKIQDRQPHKINMTIIRWMY
jgi:hypothetical protein